MVLIKKNIIFIVTIIAIGFIISCEKEFNSNSTDCEYCYTDEPEFSELIIKLTIKDSTITNIPITVFEGDIEDNREVFYDTIDTNKIYVEVELGKTYSVTAEYFIGGKTIIAVDSDKIKTRYTSEDCSDPCYKIVGGYIDVRLKEEYY